jgi:murein DD-endopeptidase MepM/ murein hydrolase activator NlpD
MMPGRLVQLRFIGSNGELSSIARDDEQLTASSGPAPTDIQWQMASGQIHTSLFDAADAIGLPDAVTLQLADVFAGDIDVYNDLRRGDRFAVVYEKRYVDGEAVGAGRIIAAEFTNSGKTFRAFLWRDANGSEAYYGADGAARRAAFLRSPMQYSRITSGFSNARFHPILHTWRAHKGVDYAAPIGYTGACGRRRAGRVRGLQNGYGNVIEVKHHGAFSTLYAHLSDFAPQVEFGAQVAQGDVIGFVGQTGCATGPHLHYEFRVDDAQRDPATVALPEVEPLVARQSSRVYRAHQTRAGGARVGAGPSRSRAGVCPIAHRPFPSDMRRERYVGVMSGTSLDGVDAVVADFNAETCAVMGAAFRPFAPALRRELLALQTTGDDELARAAQASNALADVYAEAITRALAASGVTAEEIAAAGVHGQTVRHRPDQGFTLQLNNAGGGWRSKRVSPSSPISGAATSPPAGTARRSSRLFTQRCSRVPARIE